MCEVGGRGRWERGWEGAVGTKRRGRGGRKGLREGARGRGGFIKVREIGEMPLLHKPQ